MKKLLLLLSVLCVFLAAPVAEAGNGGRNNRGMKISKKSAPPKKSSSSSGKYSGSGGAYHSHTNPYTSTIDSIVIFISVSFSIGMGILLFVTNRKHKKRMARLSKKEHRDIFDAIGDWRTRRVREKRAREERTGLRFLRDDIGEALALEWEGPKPLFWSGYALSLSMDANTQELRALVTAFPVRARELVIPLDSIVGLWVELAERTSSGAFLARLFVEHRSAEGARTESLLVLIPSMDLRSEARDFMFRMANILPKRASEDPFRREESLQWAWYIEGADKIRLANQAEENAKMVPRVEASASY